MSEIQSTLHSTLGNISRNNDAPLYAQIQRGIEIGIATNQIRPGDMIAGEMELANTYGVSRVTVRSALRELVTEGLLYRIQGKGTFVSQPIIQRDEPHVTSFYYEMVESGRKPTAIFTTDVISPSVEICRLLQIDYSEKVIITKRTRFVDQEPIVYQVNTTRYSLVPGLALEDLSNQSFQYTLEMKYGLRIVEVREELSSEIPDEEIAKALELSKGTPILRDTRILYGFNQLIIGVSQAFFRGDRYTFKVTRRIDPCND